MPRRCPYKPIERGLRRMDIELNYQHKDNLAALEEISVLPLMLDTPFYRNYPAMKLGRRQQIDFFSRKLGAMAAELLQNEYQKNGPDTYWTITAPPYVHLPSAANLLARGTHDLLLRQGFSIPLVELRLTQQQVAIHNQEEFKSYNDYSKNSLHQRIAERRREQQTLDAEELLPQFKGRSVIIINDINVTGTQQYFLQQKLDRLQVHRCFWLYLVNVETSLAKRHPEIEHQINNSQINDLDSYAAILADGQTQHTARCISRLFNENMEDFRYLAASLNEAARVRIYHLARQEGRYGNALFAEKMQLLATNNPTFHP
jgi:hypothetical protein